MSLLDKMKNFFNRNKTDNIEYIQPLMDYNEAKTFLDNLGGIEFCKAQKKKGLTQKEVAKNLNIKQPALSQYCINKGCKWKNLSNPPKAKVKPIKTTKKNRIQVLEELGGYDYIIKQRDLGKTYSQISVELGQASDDTWISNYMRYRGYKTKENILTGESKIIDNAGGIIFLKGELKNRSVSDIANELGVRSKAVYSYLYKRGYNMKTIRQNENIVEVPEGAANWQLYEDWNNNYTIDQFKKAIELKGVAKTAEALNCTENTLRIYCTYKGIVL